MNILITGATGALGQSIVNQLNRRGISNVVLGARNPQKLPNTPLQTRRVDYDDPESMRWAFSGVDTLLMISSNADDATRARQHADVISAAQDAAVERILYTSFVGAAQPSDNALLRVHHDTEELLRSSGIPWVALRNGLYLDVLPMLLGPFRDTHVVAHPAGDAPVAWISRDDIAAFTVEVLLDPDMTNVAIDVVPPEAHSLADVVRTASRLTGLPVQYVQPSDDEYRSNLKSFGMDARSVEGMSLICRAMREEALNRSGNVFAQRLGRQPESLPAYLERSL